MTSRYFTEAEAEAHQRRVRGLGDKVSPIAPTSMDESCATIERVVQHVIDTERLDNCEFVELGMGTMRIDKPAPQLTLLQLRAVAFILPMPPSVNEAWWHNPSGGNTLTDVHRQFRTNVISRVRAQMRTDKPLTGRLELTLRLYFSNRRRADIDNRVKPVQDALTHAQAYRDDSQIDRLVVERVLGSRNEECSVQLREIAS